MFELLPYEIVIYVLKYLSAAEILNLNLPKSYQKSVLIAKVGAKRIAMTTTTISNNCIYYQMFLKNSFFVKKKISISKCKRIIVLTTFDCQYISIKDLILCFLNYNYRNYGKHIVKNIDCFTIKHLLNMYCPDFIKNHSKCCTTGGKCKFVKIHDVLLFILSCYSFGKCYLKTIDDNIKCVFKELKTMSNFKFDLFCQ